MSELPRRTLTDAVPNAAARGQVRLFRQKVAASSAAIERAYSARAVHADVNAWFAKRGKGQQRAEARIKRRLAGVLWHQTHLPLLIGAYLHPSDPVIMQPRDPGQTQQAVVVRYLVFSENNRYSGIWTLEVPDHALGRIAERMPGADLERVLFSGHNEALRIGLNNVSVIPNKAFLVGTPPYGSLLCEFVIGPDKSMGLYNCYLRARTWYHSDDTPEHLRVLERGKPALGENFLLPSPMRQIRKSGEILEAAYRQPR